MKNICIVGDSWGCGEWDRVPDYGYTVTHLGIEQFLRYPPESGAKCLVTNLSVGGSDNLSSLGRLHTALQVQTFDLVLWFISDPLREMAYFDHESVETFGYQQLIDFNDAWLLTTLQSAEKLGQDIYCLGGSTKLQKAMFDQFTKLKLYMPSVAEWLCPTYRHPRLWQSNWLKFVDTKFDLETLDRLIFDKRLQDSLAADKRYSDFFMPDGGHPNRHGHHLLYHKIARDFNLKGETK